MSAWSPRGENIILADSTGDQPCQALCAAVCSCHGLLTYAIEDYSFNGEKFESFLKDVRGACGDEKVYLFLDNSSVHHSEPATKAYRELNIEPVWNVPYRPQYNDACEKYWAHLKSHFRPLLLKKMIDVPGRREQPMKQALLDVILTTSTKTIPKFVERGLNSLSKDAETFKEELNWQ